MDGEPDGVEEVSTISGGGGDLDRLGFRIVIELLVLVLLPLLADRDLREPREEVERWNELRCPP